MELRKTLFIAFATIALTPLLACQVSLGDWSRCDLTAERAAAVDAAGAARVEVDAGAGDLVLVGREGAPEVSARGTACADRQSVLDRIQLEVAREGEVIYVRTLFPERTRGRAQLDLTVELPAELPVTALDGSGPVEVDGVAALRLDDGSGSIDVRNVPGEVEITDGSGEVDVSGVGSLRITDGSGEIEVRNVIRDVVVVSDGSGEIKIAGVGGSVTIEEDGSGEIEVSNVGGNLTVLSDGSGGVDVDGVEGEVRLP